MAVDTRGLACPQPVILTKNALAKENSIEVLVDNVTAKTTFSDLPSNQGCKASVSDSENVDEWVIKIDKTSIVRNSTMVYLFTFHTNFDANIALRKLQDTWLC